MRQMVNLDTAKVKMKKPFDLLLNLAEKHGEKLKMKRMKNPFRTVTTEYYEEYETSAEKVTPDWQGMTNRRIRVVTTDDQYTGSKKDPIVSTSYEYL